MKITHNKVGQNLNTVDGAKSGAKSNSAEAIKNKHLSKALAPNGADISQAGVDATKVDVSPRAQEAKRIKELAMAAPDVDEAKVAKFRQLIDEGKYKIDAKAIADKMVDEHLETM